MRALFIIATMLTAAPAMAQTPATTPAPTRAVLVASAPTATTRVIIDGATWKCEGTACVAAGGSTQPATRACRRVVARLGAVSEFAWKGTVLSADELAACNA